MPNHVARKIQRLIPFIATGFVLLAAMLARHQFSLYHITHIRDLIFSFSFPTIGKAVLFATGSYLAAAFYDRLGLHYAGKYLPPAKTMLAAFISFAVSHNAGHAWVSGTSLRYRFYPVWGLKGGDVIKVMLANSITYAMGIVTLLLFFYAITSHSLAGLLPITGLHLVMGLIAAVYVAYWIVVLWWRPAVTVRGVRLHLPNGRLTLAQLAIGSMDVFLAGMVLYTFLFAVQPVPLGEFFVIYLISLSLGSFSQLPGGLGVFESVFLQLLSARYTGADMLAALVLYRIIYYFVPLSVACLLLFAYELRSHRHIWPVLKKSGHR